MWDKILEEFSGRGIGVVLAMMFGGIVAWMLGQYRRHLERRSIMRGDARDTVIIHQHLIESEGEGANRRPRTLRIRCVGQAEVRRVVPNGHLASVLTTRAEQVTTKDTLISMAGAEGSYLLESLTNFVCDRVANSAFDHDLFVMAPVCEPEDLSEHQPITIILIAVADLALFENWPTCREVEVEHGSDGARVLTLMEIAKRFRREQVEIEKLREEGKRTRHIETMYKLDLALDKRAAPMPTKPVPWNRFETFLKRLDIE